MATSTKKTTPAKKTTATKAAPARKSMAPKRKGKRQYPLVDVNMTGWDGAFVLPKLDTLPLGISAKLADGDVIALVDFLRRTRTRRPPKPSTNSVAMRPKTSWRSGLRRLGWSWKNNLCRQIRC